LEDWLRRTPGGSAYDRKKEKELKLQKKHEEERLGYRSQRLSSVVQMQEDASLLGEIVDAGYDADGTDYDGFLLNAEDFECAEERTAKLDEFAKECFGNPDACSPAWDPILTDGGIALPEGVRGWARFNKTTKFSETFACCRVKAKPEQVGLRERGGRAPKKEIIVGVAAAATAVSERAHEGRTQEGRAQKKKAVA
jgi:hypothetical protein